MMTMKMSRPLNDVIFFVWMCDFWSPYIFKNFSDFNLLFSIFQNLLIKRIAQSLVVEASAWVHSSNPYDV